MKKLFTIACTLVLGCSLGFAQASTTQNPPASGDQTKTGTSTTTKHHKHSGKKSKKSKKSTEGTPAPAPSPK